MALQLDLLTRVRNIRWAGGVYAIIIAEGAYAIANPDPVRNVRVIETKTDPEVTGITGAPVTATLLEPPANAGADFATINATAGLPDAAERVEVIVVPKSETAKAQWFEMYVVPISGERAIPTAPFLWLLNTMQFTEPRLIRFKIRHAPHLTPPPGRVPMVQMYPTTEPTESQMGYSVWAYRTDTKGTGTKFRAPPEWSTDVITNLGAPGLLFETDPPLIAADIPLVP
jgi:hypothetical protein